MHANLREASCAAQVLLPMRSASLTDVPAVTATFLQKLSQLGACGGSPSTAPATQGVGAITDPVCHQPFYPKCAPEALRNLAAQESQNVRQSANP
jgi:hypothetical protein